MVTKIIGTVIHVYGISSIMAGFIVFGVGIAFDAVILSITKSRQSPQSRSFYIVLVNNCFILFVLAITYYVDGFVPHGKLGEGYLHWSTTVGNFMWAYVPINIFMFLRSLHGERK